jgi:hypothetical protein
MGTESTVAIARLADGCTVWASSGKGKGSTSQEGVIVADQLASESVPDKKASRKSVLALPSSQMVMRVLDFPVDDADELAAMTELQVDKISPFPLDQMVVSHEVLNQENGHSVVLAAAARTAGVDDLGTQLIHDHRIGIARVDALLLGRWHTLQKSGELEQSGRETLVLVEPTGIDVLTHEGGIPIGFSALGASPSEIDAECAEDLAQEIVHLLMGIEAEKGPAQDTVVTVWSDERDVSELMKALEKHFSGRVKQRLLERLPSAIAGVAARAVDAAGSKLDLTPPAWRQSEGAKRFNNQLMVVSAVLLGVWVLLVVSGFGAMAWQRNRIKQLQSADQQWLEPANAVRRLRMQAQLIKRYMDRRTSALECLREVSLLQPPGVDLSSFSYRKGEGLELVGEADSGLLVNQFNEKLNASELFQEVKPGPRTLTKGKRHRFSFEITFNMEESQ